MAGFGCNFESYESATKNQPSLLAYIERIDANSASEFNRCKKVLKELHRKPNSYSDGVTFKEVEGLFRFLSCVEDIEMALDMHTSANVELTKKEFKHVAYWKSLRIFFLNFFLRFAVARSSTFD